MSLCRRNTCSRGTCRLEQVLRHAGQRIVDAAAQQRVRAGLQQAHALHRRPCRSMIEADEHPIGLVIAQVVVHALGTVQTAHDHQQSRALQQPRIACIKR